MNIQRIELTLTDGSIVTNIEITAYNQVVEINPYNDSKAKQFIKEFIELVDECTTDIVIELTPTQITT